MTPADLPYRPCVGIMLVNNAGKIWVGERIDTPGAWQMPQGGIDEGETIREAAFRELEEEIGVPQEKCKPIARTFDWLTYDLPEDLVNEGKLWGGKYRGQKQHWYLLKFNGSDDDITIDTAHPEFGSWQWVDLSALTDLIVPFKKAVYESLIEEFQPFMRSVTAGDIGANRVTQYIDPSEPVCDIDSRLWPDAADLFKWWNDARGDKYFPSRSKFSPFDFPKMLPHLMLFDCTENDPIKFRLIGSRLVELMGADYTGQNISVIQGGSYTEQSIAHLVRNKLGVLDRNIPIYWAKIDYLRYDLLILPLSDDQEKVNMLIASYHVHQ